MLIPARYTEVLDNLIKNPIAKEQIDIAMSSYPLYERKEGEKQYIPSYIPTREQLNTSILNYYRYREIGFETFGRFLQELETSLNEIMPYYNQLYFSTDQDYNVLYNVDYTREISRSREDTDTNSSASNQTSETSSTGSDSSTTSATVDNYSKNISSQTPQSQLSVGTKDIDNVEYADNATWNHNDNSDNATSTGTSSTSGSGEVNATVNSNGTRNEDETTLETVKGNYGQMSYQSLLEKYRELIINVTQQIINDPRIQELFMLVY